MPLEGLRVRLRLPVVLLQGEAEALEVMVDCTEGVELPVAQRDTLGLGLVEGGMESVPLVLGVLEGALENVPELLALRDPVARRVTLAD